MTSLRLRSSRGIWLAAALTPLLALAVGAALANGASTPTATASATCSVKALDPFRSGNKLVALGRAVCTNGAVPGDVTKVVVKTCLQRLVLGSWSDRKCERRVRRSPGKVVARAAKFCPEVTTEHRYRVWVRGSARSSTGYRAAATVHSVPPPDNVYSRRC